LKASGERPGVLGTIDYRFAGKAYPAPVTTPESLDIMRLIREMADGGATHVIHGSVLSCP
jgi:UDP-N-acetylmuramoyl-L-alanyl-D-glutamate--2,6-diaminopimelate ligase